MAYILDNKKDLDPFVVVDGSESVVSVFKDTQIKATFIIGATNSTKYTFPPARAPGAGYVLKDVLGNGILTWALVSSGARDPCQYEFKQIIDSGTNYNITMDDCALEIISDTYTTVTLPTAVGSGGKIFLISRGSNTKFNLLTQPGEKIDERNSYNFLKKYVRMTVMSNNVDSFYII